VNETVRCRDRLSASDMLQVRKVIEHLYEKVIGQGSDGGSQAAGPSAANVGSAHVDKTDRDDDLSSIADEKVELLCNDQVPPTPSCRIIMMHGSPNILSTKIYHHSLQGRKNHDCFCSYYWFAAVQMYCHS